LAGGLAIALSIVLIGLTTGISSQIYGFALGVGMLAVLGAVDDHKYIPAVVRLTVQTLAVAVGMYTLGGVRLTSVGDLLGAGIIDLGPWSLPFTLFAAVGIINAINMIDGVDGLAGGFAVMVFGVILGLAGHTSMISVMLLYLSLGSVAGFLLFNIRLPWRHHARVFLGDAGSLVLGYMLVWFAIEATQGYVAVMRPITAVWLFGLPLMDTLYLMGARLLRGDNPLSADRRHFHHLLLRSGFTPGWVFCIWLLVAAGFIAVGVGGEQANLSEALMCAVFLCVLSGYCALMTVLGRRAEPVQVKVPKES